MVVLRRKGKKKETALNVFSLLLASDGAIVLILLIL